MVSRQSNKMCGTFRTASLDWRRFFAYVFVSMTVVNFNMELQPEPTVTEIR